MGKAALRKWADTLGVPTAFRKAVAGPYDLALVLLGDDYLDACALDASVKLGGPTLLFCGKNTLKRLPKLATCMRSLSQTPRRSASRVASSR